MLMRKSEIDLEEWWHGSTVYQIYPRSFCDSNGDGIGDLPGIISKLDYLENLGIDVIWLSPIYRSPMADMGYDIADYRAIAPEFGTDQDFDRLLNEARQRGIGIVMDLAVNHTSDRHAWFIASRASKGNAYRDFYIWRDPAPGGGPPNDLQSAFGGPAWTFDQGTGQYYLHLFAPEQPDLNWSNPAVRSEIHTMMRWWLDRGIAGFRLDVINLIGKEPDHGIVENGPQLHPYLREMHEKVFAHRNVLVVGETWGVTSDQALLFSGRDRRELSMVFQFEHVTQRWDEAQGKWATKPVDPVSLKSTFNKWQTALASDGWNSLFWSNHDLARAVSSWGDDERRRVRSAKMLATVLHFMRGTPYVYQGEEIGMTNARFDTIDQYRDVETLAKFHSLPETSTDERDSFLLAAQKSGRDNARTPMQWTAGDNAGFTSGKPWIDVNPNHRFINVEANLANPNSIFAFYRHLISLRKNLRVIIYGEHVPLLEDDPAIVAYARRLDHDCIVVIANFSGQGVTAEIPDPFALAGQCLAFNVAERTEIEPRCALKPFEAFAILHSAEDRKSA